MITRVELHVVLPNWLQPGKDWAVLIFRTLMFLLLGSSVLSFAFYIGTGQQRFRQGGLRILKWTVVAALVFFGGLILSRIA